MLMSPVHALPLAPLPPPSAVPLLHCQGGKRELVIDVDDGLINGGSKYRRIPRADVAEFVVQCLALPEADNRSVREVARAWTLGGMRRSSHTRCSQRQPR